MSWAPRPSLDTLPSGLIARPSRVLMAILAMSTMGILHMETPL